ncbi:MAG: hypothetical protein ACYS8I_04315 [Planctomycetota bacterium]
MSKGDSNLSLLVILIGSLADEFVRRTMNLLERFGVEFVHCDNVYSAVGDLAKRQSPNTLIISRIGLLSKEQGRFFHIAREKGYRCCCLVDRDLVGRRKLILQAIESGAYLIEKPADIEEMLMKVLASGKVCSSGEKENRRASGFLKDEFFTTKAELDALLEVQSDEKP